MNVSLTPKLEAFVRGKVQSGLYNNASEVMREALRLLVARDGARPEAPAIRDPVSARLAALEAPLRARGVASLALFGSVLRGEAGADSDIDIMVEIDPAAGLGLWEYVGVIDFIEEMFPTKVDVANRASLKPHVRPSAERDAVYAF